MSHFLHPNFVKWFTTSENSGIMCSFYKLHTTYTPNKCMQTSIIMIRTKQTWSEPKQACNIMYCTDDESTCSHLKSWCNMLYHEISRFLGWFLRYRKWRGLRGLRVYMARINRGSYQSWFTSHTVNTCSWK